MTARKRSDWYSDTDPKALEVFLGLQRAMSAAAKLDLTLELSEIVMRLSEADVRSQYPDANDREVFPADGRSAPGSRYDDSGIRVGSQSLKTALEHLIEALRSLHIPFMIGGSLASSIHGVARATVDVDLVADIHPTFRIRC